MMRILFVSPHVPFPPLGGAMSRTYHLVRTLASRHEVTLAGFTFGQAPAEPDFAVRVVAVTWEWPRLYKQMEGADEPSAVRAAEELAAADREPWIASYFDSPAMEEALRGIMRERYDVVVLEGTAMAR